MINVDLFLLKQQKARINKTFIKDGWITVYESSGEHFDSALIYACLVEQTHVKEFMETSNWGIRPGSEGKPSVFGSTCDGKSVSEYKPFGEEHLEPVIFCKFFSHNKERYVDISEDFVNYFQLYEQLDNKQHRDYYFTDEMGELEHIIEVRATSVRIKWKFMLEFISIRRICLSIGFDFMNTQAGNIDDIAPYICDDNIVDQTKNYRHLIHFLPDDPGNCNVQSWIRGKVIILYDPEITKSHFEWLYDKKYESFITGYDDRGELAYTSCEDDHSIKLTYFKKEVLDKYYNDAEKYEVDSFEISCDYFSLKIDNNVLDYVPVFVHYLKSLPHKEQLYWKHYNIEAKEVMAMSPRYYDVMIEGNWTTKPSTPDFYFKEAYKKFNDKWQTKFGWPFYKELTGLDQYQFKSLHIPTSNNIKSFCDQIMALIKITIDGINEQELVKGIALEPNDKGLTKFEKYLKHHQIEIPDTMDFLRNLQALRSGLMAHRFSKSHNGTQKVLKFFNIRDDNYKEVACVIFIKSVYTLSTLSKFFLNGASLDDN